MVEGFQKHSFTYPARPFSGCNIRYFGGVAQIFEQDITATYGIPDLIFIVGFFGVAAFKGTLPFVKIRCGNVLLA
jgi:hypothetical protein